MSASLLAINAGSSSLKFALYTDAATPQCQARGEISAIGSAPRFYAVTAAGLATSRDAGNVGSAAAALEAALGWIEEQFPQVHFAAVGHRIVHGGTRFRAPLVLDDAALNALEALDPLAPQHQPYNLAAVRELRRRFPAALPVACFDTAFHAGWQDSAARLAIPRRFHDAGVRRYGFHGLSYEYLSARMRALLPAAARIVYAHLGSGASMCAVRDGRSVDCTMGFSVLDGLPMGTRSGAVDPGVIFHLHRQYGLDFEQIERLLYYECGLKGMSGGSADMRVLLADTRSEARQAVAVFVRHCVAAAGAMCALLGGLDALVFSGGIGAHAPALRQSICAQLQFLGIVLDAQANTHPGGCISAAPSRVAVFALETDEEQVIAAHCRALLAAAATPL